MSFQFTDEHIHSYHVLGYTIFRGIVPPSLIGDLRREAEKARAFVREKLPDSLRLQPITDDPAIDLTPFRAYTQLPELNDALARLFSCEYWYGVPDGQPCHVGILLEPAKHPCCTPWHRDWRDNIPGLPMAEWEAKLPDLRFFNQVNCALYDDGCTWIVPGSHARRDLPGEFAVVPHRPVRGPEARGTPDAEHERNYLAHCRQMPGGVQVHLSPGDFMLYRNTSWHLGNYVPYQKRATLHHVVDTPEYLAWRNRVLPLCEQRRKAGLEWEKPTPIGLRGE